MKTQINQKITIPGTWKIHPLVDQNVKVRESCYRYLEHNITSKDTKQTYRRAIIRLMKHCEELSIDDLLDVEPGQIKDYVEGLKDAGKKSAAQTVFYASKAFFQQCVDDGVLSVNPCGSVSVKFKKPKYGKTSVLKPPQINAIILSVPCLDDENPPKQSDMRDRALITLMAYTFARIGGALSARVRDFYHDDGRYWLRMIEKGEDEHLVPIPRAAAEKILEYIEYAGLTDPESWLFQSANRSGKMTGRPYDRSNSRDMIKQRAITALGVDLKVTNHTFRASGITRALDLGKSFELVQEMANHSDSETTKLYDRTRKQRLAAAMDDFDYE